MMPFCRLIIFPFLLIGCSQPKIETSFNHFLDQVKLMDAGEIINLIDQDSKDYLFEINNLLQERSSYGLTRFVKDSEVELMTRLLYQCLVTPDSIKNTKDYELEEMILMAQFAGLGILNPETAQRVNFKEVKNVKGNQAILAASVRANFNTKTYIVTDYIFNKEEGVWKINLPSTLRLHEKFLHTQWQKTGGSAQTFVKEYIENVEQYQEVSFRARIKAN